MPTITVNTDRDTVDPGDGLTSLREAVAQLTCDDTHAGRTAPPLCAAALTDSLGKMPAMGRGNPDYPAPIVRQADGQRKLAMARWGMPTPPQFLVGKKTDRGVTNILNTKSPYWQP